MKVRWLVAELAGPAAHGRPGGTNPSLVRPSRGMREEPLIPDQICPERYRLSGWQTPGPGPRWLSPFSPPCRSQRAPGRGVAQYTTA